MIRPLEIVFTRRATRHVEKAARWWRENRPKGPDALREDLEQALQLIAANPEIGVVARDVKLAGVRRVSLDRIHYYLYYRISDSSRRSSTSWPSGTASVDRPRRSRA